MLQAASAGIQPKAPKGVFGFLAAQRTHALVPTTVTFLRILDTCPAS